MKFPYRSIPWMDGHSQKRTWNIPLLIYWFFEQSCLLTFWSLILVYACVCMYVCVYVVCIYICVCVCVYVYVCVFWSLILVFAESYMTERLIPTPNYSTQIQLSCLDPTVELVIKSRSIWNRGVLSFQCITQKCPCSSYS